MNLFRSASFRWGFASVLGLLVLLASPEGSAQQRVVMGADQIPEIGATQRAAIIDSVCKSLREVYVFPDAAAEMEDLLRKKLRQKVYQDLTSPLDFAMQLTEDLRSVTQDLHLGVRYLPPEAVQQEEELSDEERQERFIVELRSQNFGFRKVERLSGNIGYLDLRQFADAEYAGATAIAAMNFLGWTDALIIDLRQNGGGSPSMIQLISSYFFEEPVHLNSFYIRRTDTTKQFWSHAHVEGPRMTEQPIYVLTSGNTFSAAEEFTYNLKNLERATIIGETTGGGAHPVEFHRFPNLHIGLSVPFGRAVNPVTGTNWEGTGVEPHISVPADEAFDVAQIEAVKALMEKDPDQEERGLLEWTLAGLESRRNPITLSRSEMEVYTGTYGPRKITFEDGGLVYQREDRPKYRLIPMAKDLFALDGLDFFRLRFEEIEGKAGRVVGLYEGGRQDMNPRTGD
jgi:hypothetical protein